jgi:hypothetical protein
MGFNPSTPTISIIAKLTPYGRAAMVSNNNNLITTFRLGDSDANYYAANLLTSGQIPAESGEIGVNGSISNSTTQVVGLKSFLILNGKGIINKPVESQSSVISSEVIANGQITISGTNLTQKIIDRKNYQTDSLVNLFYSFGLPLNSKDDNTITGVTFANGGYSDTALSGIAQTKILVIGINNSKYGESLDGKQIKLDLVTSAGTYSIYSTFQNKGASLKVEDVNIRDTSLVAGKIDNNIAFLFSDTIQKPNNSISLSWATGFGLYKPFSIGEKRLYNLQSNPNIGAIADKVVGIVYLDKGFCVITNPTIIGNYDSVTSSASTVTFNSVSTAVFQNITCIASRGEFISSTNRTFGGGDVPRVSEIGLYDREGRLVAMGKTDRHVEKNVNSPLYLGVKISL